MSIRRIDTLAQIVCLSIQLVSYNNFGRSVGRSVACLINSISSPHTPKTPIIIHAWFRLPAFGVNSNFIHCSVRYG